MSSHEKHDHKKTYVLTGPWANAWKTFAAIGVVGLAGSIAGAVIDPKRFAFSWLWAFCVCLTIALGSLFFVMIQHLTSAGWSVTVRRTAEFFGNGILILIPLFIPVVLFMGQLFPWVNGEEHGTDHEEKHGAITLIGDAHAQEKQEKPALNGKDSETGNKTDHKSNHGDAVNPNHPGDITGHLPGSKSGVPSDTAATEHGAPHMGGQAHGDQPDPHAVAHHELMQKKSGYLNKNFFFARMAIYFLIWVILAVRLFGYSVTQDSTKDPKLTLSAAKFSTGGMMLYALSLTFAAFDWVMSLEPAWFSTIFGVIFFACGVVSSLAVIILTTMALKNSGPLEGAVNKEHFHDLGKLMFGFLVFWAYVQFSQFMLIWYAALPEEVTWYHNRWDFAPWPTVSMIILLGHFVAPFFWLISRNFKRNLGRLQLGAAWLLVMHCVDMYWFVMPNYLQGKPGFSVSWIDFACLIAVSGIYAAFVFYRMTKFSLVPVGDPRLERALHFQNA